MYRHQRKLCVYVANCLIKRNSWWILWKSMLCVGNSSVVKIYIIRPKPGPVAKNATSKAFRLGMEPASPGLLDQCSTTELSQHWLSSIDNECKCQILLWWILWCVHACQGAIRLFVCIERWIDGWMWGVLQSSTSCMELRIFTIRSKTQVARVNA